MAERITLHADADVATWSSGIAAGAGDHLPVGYYGGAKYRSAIRFDAPGAWDGWTNITQATLNIWTSDHSHVAPKNSSIYVRRMTIASLWTKAPGGTDCETGFSAGNNTQYDDIAPVSADQATFSSGSTANYKRSIGVTLMTVTYWENSTSHLVFVLDPVSVIGLRRVLGRRARCVPRRTGHRLRGPEPAHRADPRLPQRRRLDARRHADLRLDPPRPAGRSADQRRGSAAHQRGRPRRPVAGVGLDLVAGLPGHPAP